jgi:hypothetical protein
MHQAHSQSHSSQHRLLQRATLLDGSEHLSCHTQHHRCGLSLLLSSERFRTLVCTHCTLTWARPLCTVSLSGFHPSLPKLPPHFDNSDSRSFPNHQGRV